MKRHKFLILTVLWMIIIFMFSAQDGGESSKNNVFIIEMLKYMGIDLSSSIPLDLANFIIRKAAHFFEYFILGLLIYKTLESYLWRFEAQVSAAAAFLYACSDELHQYFIPGRAAQVRDVLIDTAGAVMGILIIWLTKNRHKIQPNMYRYLDKNA